MLKRFLVLALGLVLFVTAFFIHQWWTDAELEHQFRAEREKFQVDGQNLVTASPPASEPLTPTAPPIPVVSTGAGDATLPAPAPAAVPAGTNAPAEVPLDSNTLIGPMPPPAAPASNPGDTNAPAAPSTNSPDSTFIYPGLHQLPLVLVSGYSVSPPRVQDTGAAPAAPIIVPAPASTAPNPEPAPGTNTPATPNAPVEKMTPAPAATNSAPAEVVSESKTGKSAISAIVLLYHQFTPPGVRAGPKFMWTMPQDVFAYEMKYLHDNHFNVVPLADVIAFAKGLKELPPNAVAITFDDGYKSPLVFAVPILKQYNFPWTFFIYPAFIGDHPSSKYWGAASWPELVELQKEGVDIECHSMTHPYLSKTFQIWPPKSGHPHRLSPDEYEAFLTDELVTSKQIIEQHLNKTVTCLAYPFGDYNTHVQARALAAGYEAIFTVAGNPIHVGSPLKSMGRYTLTSPEEKMFTAWLNQRSLILSNITPEPGSITTDPKPVISAVVRYAGDIKAGSIDAEVSGMGEVKTDFDPKSSTLRLYLPRDIVADKILVDVRAKDAESGHTLAASWRFGYQPTAAGVAHRPIGASPETNAPPQPAATVQQKPALPATAAAPNAHAETAQPLVAAPPGATAPASSSNAVPAVRAESATVSNTAP